MMRIHVNIAFVLAMSICARGAQVYRTTLNILDLDRDPLVVTNVSFSGMATEQYVDASVIFATNEIAHLASVKQDKLPYETNAIPYSAISGTPSETDLSPATNYTDYAISMLVETNDVLRGGPYLTSHQSLEPATNYADRVSSTAARSSTNYTDSATNNLMEKVVSDISTKQDRLPYDTNAIPYSAISGSPEIDLSPATNYADYAISRFSETNSILSGGPYLKHHQSLEPATNYTDSATNEVMKNAMSGISIKQDRLPYQTNAIPYSAVIGTPDLSKYAEASDLEMKQDALPYPTSSIPYSVISGVPPEKSADLTPATNYTDYAISMLAETNDILRGGPYLTNHQSLEPSTNYTDSATNEVLRKATENISGKQDSLPYLTNAIPYSAISGTPDLSEYATRTDLDVKQDSLPYPTNAIPYSAISGVPPKEDIDLSPATNYTDYVVSRFAETNSILSGGPYLTEHQSLEPATNYTDSATNEVMREVASEVEKKQDLLPYPTNQIPYSAIEGTPDLSEKQDALPYKTNAIPYSAISGSPSLDPFATWEALFAASSDSTNYTDSATNVILSSVRQDIELKQDKLPYPTNAIPYSSVSGTPDMSTKQDNLPYDTNAIPYSAISGTPDMSKYATMTDLEAKQDSLPYDTNAIPYSAISGAPEIDLAPATNYTDYAIAKLAETNDILKGGPYLTSHQSLEPSTNYTDSATNGVFAMTMFAVTNTYVVGYTEWAYSGNTVQGTSYTINSSQSGSDFVFTLYDPSALDSVTTNVLHPTMLEFSQVGIVARRSEIRRNANGLAMYSDVQELDTKLETMDTSYFRTNVAIAAQATTVVCPSNRNQTVQFINAPAGVNRIEISLPKEGITKDWLVYIEATDEIAIGLPPADYWAANAEVTNNIPSNSLTALYFSQVSDNVYSIGRQSLIPITILSPQQRHMQAIRESARKIRRILRK